MKKGIQFQEVQQFRQGWFWYLLISSSLLCLIPVIVFMASGQMEWKEGMLVTAMVLGITIINISAFYYARLETRIADDGISFRWWPFFRKFSVLRWEDIDQVNIAQCNAFKLGFHFDRKYGRVHNVDGKNGYQVILKNGKKYFFGTQRKLSVENVLQQTGKLKL